MVDVQLALLVELIHTVFYAPPDVFELGGLEDVESLSQSREMFSVGGFSSFAKFMLIVSDQLITVIFSV